MLSYATVGSNDLEMSVPFFTELPAMQNVTKLVDHPRGGVLFGREARLVFGVLTPFDRAEAKAGDGGMVAFDMPNRDAVDASHAKALALGGADERPPGKRGPCFFMSYFRDLDGNKFCAWSPG